MEAEVGAAAVAIIGLVLTAMANDSESGGKAKRIGYFLMGIGLAAIFVLFVAHNPEEVRALGHRAVVFCGFGG